MNTLDVSILIVVRPVDRFRRRNLALVLDWYGRAGLQGSDMEFVLVEQNGSARLSRELEGYGGVRHIHQEYGGPFNKASGMNLAARSARGRVLVLLDADILVDRTVFTTAVHSAGERYDVISPYKRLVYLDDEETERWRRGALRFSDLTQLDPSDRAPPGETRPFCGGSFVIPRSKYFDIGGMDERFMGWGGEDDAMSIKIERCADRIGQSDTRPGIHLWHPRTGRDRAACDPHYLDNQRLLHQYRQFGEHEWRRLIAEQRTALAAQA